MASSLSVTQTTTPTRADSADRSVFITFTRPVLGVDPADGSRFVADRHKAIATSIRQDDRQTIFINSHGEVVAKWMTEFVETVEWPSQRRAVEAADRRRTEWSAKLVDIRKRFPNAFRKWTHDQESQLNLLFDEGRTVREMSDELGRGIGGIIARLALLGLVEEGSRESDVDSRLESFRAHRPVDRSMSAQ